MERDIKLILGTVFLFTVITNGISLVTRLCSSFLFNTLSNGFRIFFFRNILWLAVVIAIICLLTIYFTKRNISIKSIFFNEKRVLLSSGILVVIDGIINLSNLIPLRILSIQNSITISQQADNFSSNLLLNNIISNIIPVVIIFIQIVVGITMIKNSKKLMAC